MKPSSSYTSPLDSLIFDAIVENGPTFEESQANLEVWANTQFTLNTVSINETMNTRSSLSYSSMDTSEVNSPNNNITYESLATYLDFELPHLFENVVNHSQKQQTKKPSKLILPKIATDSLLTSPTYASINSFEQDINNNQIKNKEKTPVDDDKRKRNTAASARFRIKKKQREQEMEKTVRAMTDKSKGLESRVLELEEEVRFLKSLLIEKESTSSNGF